MDYESGVDPFAAAREDFGYDRHKIGEIMQRHLDYATRRVLRRRADPEEGKDFVRALFRAITGVEPRRGDTFTLQQYADVGAVATVCMYHLDRLARGERLVTRKQKCGPVPNDARAVAFLRMWFDVPAPPKEPS